MAGRPPKALGKTLTFQGSVAAEIRRRRECKKLSIEKAAAKAGFAASSWYHFESGRPFQLGNLPAIAAALGCTPRDLVPTGRFNQPTR